MFIKRRHIYNNNKNEKYIMISDLKKNMKSKQSQNFDKMEIKKKIQRLV